MYKLLIIFSLLCCTNVHAQTNDTLWLTPRDTTSAQGFFIPGNFSLMDVDYLGNVYVIESGLLKKFNNKGDSVGVYNDVRRYGNPTFIDVSNPLKTLVFYKNYSTLVVLDGLLTQRTSINLRRQQIFKVGAVSQSYDNQIWVFDEQVYKLKKIDEAGKVLLESNDLLITTGESIKASSIYDVDGLIYIYDDEKGFFVLDRYGAYVRKIELKNMNSFSFSENNIFAFNEMEVKEFNLKTRLSKSYPLPAYLQKNIGLKVVNPYIYVLQKEGVFVYRLSM